MTDPLVIVVNFDAGKTSPNCLRRMCWQARKRVADEAKAAATIAWRQAGSPVWNVPVSVGITIYRGRKLDPDALLASCKNLLDALFVGRITPDDSEKWVEFGEVWQSTGEAWRQAPQVVVRVTPRSPATASAGGCAALLEIEEGEEAP